jgi:DNA recombination protein RmuC
MAFDFPLILALLTLILLIGGFLWLLMGLPAWILRGQLSKEEQLAQHVALKAQLVQLAQSNERLERELRQEITSSAQSGRLEMGQTLAGLQGNVQQSLTGFQGNLTTQLQSISEGNARRLTEVRETLDAQLTRVREALNQQLEQLAQKNEAKLDEMRRTVDEKLQTTLETRLGESFKQVADRLEQVHKGLGEMQTLAQGVGDLKHLLTNVKTRGTFGEAQLGALLGEVFVAEQFAAQIATVPGSKNVVDYAIRLPGRSDDGAPENKQCWLPIDSKFPTEDYERLLDAQERADPLAAEIAAKALEARIRLEAKGMAEKYVSPPYTTDFAILFLPSEGLYAEVLRRPGLMDTLQRDHRVTLAGPTTLLAMLNSLQMGFRTLALEQRSSEVWQVLGAVKTEFGKFGEFVSKVKSQAETVVKTLEQADTRTRAVNRKLKDVEGLTDAQAQVLLPLGKADDKAEDRADDEG